MNRRIGILGYSGLAGQVVKEYLQEQYSLRLGARTDHDRVSTESMEYMTVDAEEEKQLQSFCSGCQVIVNCIGPSYYVSEKVAKAAVEAGADYVDVFGVNLLDKPSVSTKENKQTIIIGAGSFPGLSGLLPAWMTAGMENVSERLRLYGGGKEQITLNACIDVIMSMVENFGKSGVYLSGNAFKQLRQPVQLPYGEYPEEARGFYYLTKEMEAACHASPVHELFWCNVQRNPAYEQCMKQAVIGYMQDGSKEHVLELAKALIANMEDKNPKEELWYRIYGELDWRCEEGIKTKTYRLDFKDTYQVNGFLAAACAKMLLENSHNGGIYWPFQILDGVQVIESLQEQQIATVTVEGDIPWKEQKVEQEEGEI